MLFTIDVHGELQAADKADAYTKLSEYYSALVKAERKGGAVPVLPLAMGYSEMREKTVIS